MNFHLISTIQFYLAALTVYIVLMTFAGYLATVIASLLGDDTARDYGYLSLSPVSHISVIGILFLFIYGYGFGVMIPIDPDQVKPPYRTLKQLILFWAHALALMTVVLSFIVLAGILWPLVGQSAVRMPGLMRALVLFVEVGIGIAAINCLIESCFAAASAFLYYAFPNQYYDFFKSRLWIMALSLVFVTVYAGFFLRFFGMIAYYTYLGIAQLMHFIV